jgi:GNAT superfamily N-acetyltransferase
MSYAADLARSVVRYDSGQREQLRIFQRTHFGSMSRQADDRFFDWLYEQNPHRDGTGPALWLCMRDGIIVGQQGAIPVRVKVGDAECCALWGIDLMVHPRWRLKGVGPALLFAYQQSADLCLGMGLSDASYNAFRRQGWRDMGKLTVFVRPLDPHACSQASQAPRLLKVTPKFLLSGSARLIGSVTRGINGASLEPIPTFDERAEGIWRTASPDYPVLVKRDFTALRWRFDASPNRGCYERYYLMQKRTAVGYVVVRFDEFRGHKVAHVIDCLAGARWLPSLLALTLAELSAKRAAAVFIEQLNERAAPVLKLMGCWPVTRSTHFILRASAGLEPAPPALCDAGSWFTTLADSDCDHQPREPQIEAIPAAGFFSKPEMVTPPPN